MNPAQYAEHRNTTVRTVRRWLKEGWLPGATQYPDGRWDIPRDAIEQKPLFPVETSNGHDVSPDVSGVVSVTRQGDIAVHVEGPTLAEALDRHTAFLTLEQASRLLGIPEVRIVEEPERFQAERVDDRRRLMVPQRVVRQIAGLRD